MSTGLSVTGMWLSDDIRRQVIADCDGEIDLKDGGSAFALSHDVPTVLKIIGDVVDWTLPLKAAAALYLGQIFSQLGKHTADEIWKHRSQLGKWLQSQPMRALNALASALSRVKQKFDARDHVQIAAAIPDPNLGSILEVTPEDEILIAWTIANFVVRLDSLQELVSTQSKANNTPLPSIALTMHPNGDILVEWISRDSLKKFESDLRWQPPPEESPKF